MPQFSLQPLASCTNRKQGVARAQWIVQYSHYCYRPVQPYYPKLLTYQLPENLHYPRWVSPQQARAGRCQLQVRPPAAVTFRLDRSASLSSCFKSAVAQLASLLQLAKHATRLASRQVMDSFYVDPAGDIARRAHHNTIRHIRDLRALHSCQYSSFYRYNIQVLHSTCICV